MISIAFTKEVQKKGRIRVRYSKCRAMAATRATEDRKNSNQYIPVYFFCCSIVKNLCENKSNAATNQS